MKLREYQIEPVRLAQEYLNSDKKEPALIVLPTAWGKSILTAFAAQSIPQNERLLVVQPTKELLEQNYKKYIELCGGLAQAGIFSASFGKKNIERITYATIGSIKEIGKSFKELGFTKMLIDEAHLYPRKEESMLGQFLKDSGIRQVLGITATPLKLESFSEKQGDKYDKWSTLTILTENSMDGDFFKEILYIGQIQEMIRKKFWSELQYEVLPFDKSMLRFNTSGTEFSEESVEDSYKLNNVRANIYAALNWHRERKHCLVFVPSVEEAAILASEYDGAEYICGSMAKKERSEVIERFKSGQTRVLFNVSVLAVGFDYTKIDMIIFALSMASVSRYYQMVGRGVRIDQEKKNCVIVDMGGNVERFGKVEDIVFHKTDRWRMYGTGGNLLTGIPINCLGKVNYRDICRIQEQQFNWNIYIDFGKFKGKLAEETPMSYKQWYVRQPECRNYLLRDRFIKLMEEYTRDTTLDPPMNEIPDGKYAGKTISTVPFTYLKWYYNSKKWNRFNDSLRRGIERYIPVY